MKCKDYREKRELKIWEGDGSSDLDTITIHFVCLSYYLAARHTN